MAWFLSIAILFVGLNSFALGPIPNGTYAGTETCNGMAYPGSMVLTDTTMNWDDQQNEFVFDKDSHGFFKLTTLKGMHGTGLGHFTENGIHYEAIYDYVQADGSIFPAPGEDSFTYANGTIHVEGTASAGPKGKFACTGDFSVAP